MKRVLLGLLAACGGSGRNSDAPVIDAPDTIDAAIDAPPQGAFTLTSPAYAEGGTIPTAQSCDGANTSPQLDWPAGPAGTLSYAVVFTDKSNNLRHWAIWDIPTTPLGLPANVQKIFMPSNVTGAKQVSFQATKGYMGPCPPSGTTHTYEHVVYAIDIATLPGLTMASTPMEAETAIQAHDLASAKLSAKYTRP